MDEDQILQSIIADPDLVDPNIDVSKLRQTTETNPRLLAEVPEFSGLQFDPSKRSYIEDLYSIYSGGLPQSEILQDPTTMIPQTPVIDTSIDVDGGGGGGNNIITPDTTIRDELIDEGIQAAEDDKGDMMLDEGVPVGEAYPPVDTLSFDDQYQEIEDIPITKLDEGVPVGEAYPPIDTVNYSKLDDLEADIGTQTIEGLNTEQQGLIDQAFSKVGSTASDIMNNLSQIPGAVADFANQTVDVFGKKINVGATLLKAGINKIVGGPISLVFDALGSLGLEGGRSEMSNKLGEQYGMDDIGRLTGGPMVGYAVDSAFGKGIEQTTIDRINTRKANNLDTTELEEFLEQIQRNKTAIDYDMEGTDEGDRAAEEAAVADEEFAETGDYDVYAGGGADQDPVGPDFGDTDYADPGVDAEENQPEPSFTTGGGGFDSGGFDTAPAPTPTADFYQDPITTGGGGAQGDKGGKIVCTMMNESYGFGSFRNKIWMKFHKDLSPEYQRGYHKLFLPLVKIAKTNKVVKKVLEHIAVHSTIDMRQATRGKKHLLGRVYRKIILPICYIVRKYAKR